MSSNLYMQISQKKCLDKGLKFLIEPYLREREGSVDMVKVSFNHLEYFRGLLAMMDDGDERRKDLQNIMNAINMHGQVYLSIEE